MRFTGFSLGKIPAGRIQSQCDSVVRRKKEEAPPRSPKRKRPPAQPPNFLSNMWITAFCLAITWACHINATDITLKEKMHNAITSPI
jgi:hypothetical protein